MESCIFCAIAKKESPANLEYEDEEVIAFWDVNPKAPIHILIVPKKHIRSVIEPQEEEEEDTPIIGKIITVAKNLAEKKVYPKMVIVCV